MYSVEHVKWQARLVLVGAVSLLSLFRLSDAVASGPNTPLEGNGLSAVKLDEENFPLLVNGDNSAIVLFAAPWCYHSQKVYPEFAKLASTYSLKDGVLVAHVKADEEKV
jgi:thioredoxin-like negative regulator of GroEL